MKTLSKIILILAGCFTFYSFTNVIIKSYSVSKLEVDFESEIVTVTPEIITPTVSIEPIKDYNKFLFDIGMRESTNNYKAVNQFGYLGKYQFGRATLNSLGYKEISNKEFLSSPSLQEKAMNDLLLHNKKILRRFIEKYDGQVINKVLVTESGILAAAHLAGPGNVKKWFRKGVEFKDGNGTKMTSYLKQFASYRLYL